MNAPTTRHKRHPNNARLIRIIEARHLTDERVAELASATVDTARSWRTGQRRMPNYRIELFEIRLDGLAAGRRKSA